MATDDERREVAQNMRDGVKSKTECELQSLNGSSAAIRWLISYVVFGDKKYHSGVDLMNRLADLIEPSDRNDELCVHCDYCDYCDLPKCSDQDGYSFKPKGYVDLLVLADKTIRTARHDMEICGDTVPAWYAAGRLEAVARNIREILEVES